LKVQLQQCLSVVWYGVQLLRQLMNGDDISWLVSVQRDAILNICCESECRMFFVNIFMMNGQIFYDCCSFLLQ